MSEFKRPMCRNRGRTGALIAVALLSLAAPGCLFPGDDCNAEPIPLEGSLSDYTTTAGEVGDVTLYEPAPCKEDSFYGGGHLIAMEGHGDALWDFRERSDGGCPVDHDCTVDQSIFAQSVRAALDEANIEAMAGFGDACQAQVPTCAFSYFHIRDWKLADQTVAIVLEKMALFELGECAAVLVAPEPVMCAH